jgi:hypothetical protein
MRKLVQHMFSLVVLTIVSGFGLVNHVSAMPASMHQMEHGSSHSQHMQSSSSTSRCVTLCTSAVVGRDEDLDFVSEEDDDDEPVVPFYVLTQQSIYDTKSSEVTRAVASIKPPPKVPIYILYGVFRA